MTDMKLKKTFWVWCLLVVAWGGLSLGPRLAVGESPAGSGHGGDPHAAAGAVAEMAEHGEAAGHEGGHDAHEQPGLLSVDIGSAFWTIVLFLVLVGILGKFVWPNILKGLADREAKITGDLERAEEKAQQAEATLQEYQSRLAQAQDEAKKVIEKSRADAQMIATNLKEQTQRDIELMRQRCQSDIQAAKEQAVREIYAQVADLATAVAGRILERQVNDQDVQRLIDESLSQAAGGRN